MKHVITAILGGGQGTRLWPLTARRAKPAVPIAGKFRLIDIPISNSLHAGIAQIYVLTQFNSHSLHRHIAQTYRFDAFRDGFVSILAAQQSLDNRDWYQGTADAVRKNLGRLTDGDHSAVLILSGDQLYQLDLEDFVTDHREKEADLSIAVTPVAREEASGLGIMRVDRDGQIVEFVEKPKDEETLDRLALDQATLDALGFDAPAGSLLASMGMYVFGREVLRQVLLDDATRTDFGREIIPGAIDRLRVFAYPYRGYWRDIGTIPAFHETNLELTEPDPPLNLYHPDKPIYTHPRFLPGVKVHDCQIEQSLLCDGSVIAAARVKRSVIGIRSMVREGAVIEDSILMGTEGSQRSDDGHPVPIGVGRNCEIRRAIIDRGARIGDGARLINADGVEHADGDGWAIRGGVIVVTQNAVIPAGTEI
ncbi:MAG: glucose-1-phosphate adenylyltransferase [Acidobacteriota bacterium]